MKKLIKTVEMGYDYVNIFVDDSTDGFCTLLPKGDSKIQEVVVGLDQPDFSRVLAILIHEVGELHMNKMHYRLVPTTDLSNDHASYLFLMNHVQYSEVCFVVSEVLTSVFKDIKKEYKKFKKTGSLT